jgi:2-hydroxychromene-2-carboxylate isomerase/catechol 2,3-dioxygenase-like lactoylglutathione lyase family enzyme
MADPSPRSPIVFYFDYLSSNAYLAWTQLPALAERFGRRIEPVAVVFGKLLERYGQMGPAEVPPKVHWMSKNNLRKAVALGVDLKPPAFHPFNPLLALRASSLDLPGDGTTRLVDALFRAVWSEQRHVSEPAVLEAIASEVGLDGGSVVAAAQSDEVKLRLRKQTDDALAAGVFGVPTVIVDGELFFGFDDFPWLERFLDGRDPLPDYARQWSRPQRPSAMRPQHRDRPPLRLAHVNLPARDPEAQARWYADTFGFEARGAFAYGPAGLLAFEKGEPLAAHANFHVGFEVLSKDQVVLWGRRFGVSVEEEDGYAAVRVADPEGNGIEIYWEPGGPGK